MDQALHTRLQPQDLRAASRGYLCTAGRAKAPRERPPCFANFQAYQDDEQFASFEVSRLRYFVRTVSELGASSALSSPKQSPASRLDAHLWATPGGLPTPHPPQL